jgi:hypothetical protein
MRTELRGVRHRCACVGFESLLQYADMLAAKCERMQQPDGRPSKMGIGCMLTCVSADAICNLQKFEDFS